MTGRFRRSKRESARLAGPHAEKTVSLALQGGGAHGAFTWGVLDAILEDGRLAIEAVTGASAGAMNAVVMVEGWLNGGIDGARSQLETFWRKASIGSSLSPLQRGLLRQMLGYWRNQPWMYAVTQNLGPYQVNPLNINPLRTAIDALIDFDLVRASTDVKIFISATNVWTGKITIFRKSELTADHLMASACIPTVFQAVEIHGVPYWDGGYTGNPALFPLYYETRTDDILLVQINPLERRQTPRTVREIHNRLNEITFNGTLLRELRAVAFVQRLIKDGKLSAKDYKDVHLHRIDGAGALDKYQASSRLITEWDFFKKLRGAGRQTAQAWLAENYDEIGVRATVDLESVLR